MLLAYLYSLEKGIDFSLCSKYWNAAYDEGWNDYFVPFCEDVTTPALNMSYLFSAGGLRETLARSRKKAQLMLLTRQRVLLNYDVWPDVWNGAFAKRKFDIPVQGIDGDCLGACQVLLKRIWKFNGQSLASASEFRERLGLGDYNYFTVHIRRGDKLTEAEPVDINSYMAKVDEVNLTQLRRCFVMTDDYNVVTELQRRFPQFHFVSLCEPTEHGHLQAAFNLQSAEARRDATLRLLGELAIAADGFFFVGTFSSNVGRLIAMLRPLDTTFGADFPFRMMY